MGTIRDRFWIWGHEEGSHNACPNLPGSSRMTPAEGAYYLGVPNCLMVMTAEHPASVEEQYARSLSPLGRVVWSLSRASAPAEGADPSNIEQIVELAGRYPNITGAIMDDFFHVPPEQHRATQWDADDLERFRVRLRAARKPLDLWVVLYTMDLGLPISEYLDRCDVISYWTWKSEDLPMMEENFARLEALVPSKRKVLGCYLWDYGMAQPMSVERMEHQCRRGLEWLREGRIEGMIFLASCICDLGLEAVEWTRRWIAQVGGTHRPENQSTQ